MKEGLKNEKKEPLQDKEVKESKLISKRKEKFIQKEKKVAVQNNLKADQYESKIGVLIAFNWRT